MEKKIMLTGLQPTGTITLGNYIGAIKQMVENQENYKSIIFIADMHAITVPIDSDVLAQKIRQLIALYIACGIDPEKNLIFLQITLLIFSLNLYSFIYTTHINYHII